MNKSLKLSRIGRILTAVTRAEMARLSRTLTRAQVEQREAERLRTIAGLARETADAFDLAARSRWTDLLILRARQAEKRAADAAREAEAIRADLSRALGRERAFEAVAERQRTAEARLFARRAEDTRHSGISRAVPDPLALSSSPSSEGKV